MTPEEINIAIAEWMGWKRKTELSRGEVVEFWESVSAFRLCAPDYYNDLNAVHEAEKSMPESYWMELAMVTKCDHLPGVENPEPRFWKSFAHATAPQRCEALLRTIGKWNE